MRQKHGILFYFRILFLLWTSPWDDVPNFSVGYKLSALSSWKWKYLWLSTYILVLAMQHFSLTNIRNPSAESKIVPKNANSNKGPRFFLDLLKEWNGNFFKKRRFISIFCKKSYVTFSEKNISFADTFMHLSYASNSKIIDSPVLWGKHLVFNSLSRAFGKLEKGQKGRRKAIAHLIF